MGEDEFVAAVTEGQPARPQYFEFDARRNRELRPLLDEATPALLPIAEVLSCQASGMVLLDGREPAEFMAGHVRGAVSIGLRGNFEGCAGAVLPPETEGSGTILEKQLNRAMARRVQRPFRIDELSCDRCVLTAIQLRDGSGHRRGTQSGCDTHRSEVIA